MWCWVSGVGVAPVGKSRVRGCEEGGRKEGRRRGRGVRGSLPDRRFSCDGGREREVEGEGGREPYLSSLEAEKEL